MCFLHATSCTMSSPFYHAFLPSFKWSIWRILKPHLLQLLIQLILINKLFSILPGLCSIFVWFILGYSFLLLVHYIFEISWFRQSCLSIGSLLLFFLIFGVFQILVLLCSLCNFWFGLLIFHEQLVTVIICIIDLI